MADWIYSRINSEVYWPGSGFSSCYLARMAANPPLIPPLQHYVGAGGVGCSPPGFHPHWPELLGRRSRRGGCARVRMITCRRLPRACAQREMLSDIHRLNRSPLMKAVLSILPTRLRTHGCCRPSSTLTPRMLRNSPVCISYLLPLSLSVTPLITSRTTIQQPWSTSSAATTWQPTPRSTHLRC